MASPLRLPRTPVTCSCSVLTTNRKRVFRVTEVQMDEEGEVTIKAMEHPCEDVGGKLLSRIANFSDSLFDVR
jgi:hypothetical protein